MEQSEMSLIIAIASLVDFHETKLSRFSWFRGTR